MQNHKELASWLQAQPLGARVAIDGESVWLRPGEDGAELAACLWPDPSGEQVQAALRHGFASARDFCAGLALADDGRGLILSCWLPSCRGWSDAATALEQLLDQLAAWRALLAPAAAQPRLAAGGAARQEQRMRNLLSGALA